MEQIELDIKFKKDIDKILNNINSVKNEELEELKYSSGMDDEEARWELDEPEEYNYEVFEVIAKNGVVLKSEDCYRNESYIVVWLFNTLELEDIAYKRFANILVNAENFKKAYEALGYDELEFSTENINLLIQTIKKQEGMLWNTGILQYDDFIIVNSLFDAVYALESNECEFSEENLHIPPLGFLDTFLKQVKKFYKF